MVAYRRKVIVLCTAPGIVRTAGNRVVFFGASTTCVQLVAAWWASRSLAKRPALRKNTLEHTQETPPQTMHLGIEIQDHSVTAIACVQGMVIHMIVSACSVRISRIYIIIHVAYVRGIPAGRAHIVYIPAYRYMQGHTRVWRACIGVI